MTKDYFTVDEAAGILRVSPRIIRENFIARGKLKAFKVGKEYRINEVELQRFIQELEKTLSSIEQEFANFRRNHDAD